jgi:hypothetical protein
MNSIYLNGNDRLFVGNLQIMLFCCHAPTQVTNQSLFKNKNSMLKLTVANKQIC